MLLRQPSIRAGIVAPHGTIPAQIVGGTRVRRVTGDPSAHETIGRHETPGRNPGERFLHELSRHPFPAPRPLPVEYRPMASMIVGERRPVRVSTSPASRRALARVGKRAATTGDTIHLDRPRPAPEVIAHELTHVAHPSPTPRFFADDDRGPEERQAQRVAAVMRRSPILPGVRSLGSTPTVQRAPSAGTVSAAALATSITRSPSQTTSSPTHPSAIQRFTTTATAQTTTTSPASTTASTAPPDTPASMTPANATQHATAPTTSEALAQFERILELLEDRIMSELERRGGRFRGGL
jgi:Domain of unknown function (DUF4157)